MPQMDHPEKESISHFMKKFLKKSDYLKILWANYLSLCSSFIPDNLPSYEEMNLWVENTLHEEYMLLKCIFLLCRFHSISAEFNYEMLECFYDQSFQGSFQNHSNQKNLKIQEYYQNQLKLSQNITDICLLILLANMAIDAIGSTINVKDVNVNISPFSLFMKTGQKLFNFFQKVKDLQEISIIFMAFRSQTLFFNLFFKNKATEGLKYLYEYDIYSNSLMKFENVNYLSFIRDMLRRDIFKDAEDFLVIFEYRLLIKGWINLIGITINDSEILQNFDLFAEILYHCLNDPFIVNIYWEEDHKKQKDLWVFVNRLMGFFPLKCSRFLKLLSVLITKNNYSAVNIVRNLGDMSTYASEVRELDSEPILSLNEHNENFSKSQEDLVFNDFTIPKGTQVNFLRYFIE